MLMINSINILCFGDSLTAGATRSGTWYHPYAFALQSSLENALPSVTVTVDIQGLGGDQVTSPPGGFLPRMNTLYEDVHNKTPYDFALVLGGTNDLFQSRLPEPLFTSLQQVWDIPLQHGTKLLAITVPESGGAPPEIVQRRDILNSLILDHRADNFSTFDLHAAVPYYAMPEDERRQIWDDPVHFTSLGYDRIGQLLATRILELLTAGGVSRDNKQELKKRTNLVEEGILEVRRGLLRSGRSLRSAVPSEA